jgi:hypothetical protein
MRGSRSQNGKSCLTASPSCGPDSGAKPEIHRWQDAVAERLWVLLDEAGTQVRLYQRRITNRFEAVYLAHLDDKDIPESGF